MRLVKVAMALAVIAALAVAGGAGASAKGAKPKAGVYEATPSDLGNGDFYGPGQFGLVKDGGAFEMVPNPDNAAIFFPSVADDCNPYDVGLPEPGYPVSKAGKFKIKAKIPIAGIDDQVSVDWKGHWVDKKHVEGTIKIAFKGCATTEPYTAKRTGPPPPS